jgi:hypothetical protein
MVDVVPIDSEAPMVTLSILRICQLILLEVIIGVELRACIQKGECACVYERPHLYRVWQKKIKTTEIIYVSIIKHEL